MSITQQRTDRMKVKITEECPTCNGGRDKPFHQWCRRCNRVYTENELGVWDKAHNGQSEVLPCGDPWVELGESNHCDDCEDTGRLVQQMTLTELVGLIRPLIRPQYDGIA